MRLDESAAPPLVRRVPLAAPLACAALALAGLLGLACSSEASADEPEVWRFALEETAGSVQDAYAREFAARVAERSDGAVEVRVYPYGTLGTSGDLTEQLRMGSLQLAMASPGHLGTMIPEVQVFLLHFLFPDDEELVRRALADPELAAALAPLYAERGLHFLSAFPEGWMVWTTGKEVRTPEDFAGVKIRTMSSPLLLDTYTAYGASPQSMPYAEVYSGLQLNMIDAQVNPLFAIEEMSFYEVTSHLVFPRAAQYVATLAAHGGFFESLPAERRALLEEVVAELHPWITEHQRELNAERLESMLERKPALAQVRLTDEEREAFRERAHAVREAFVARTGERGQAVLDALLAALERGAEPR